MNITICRNLGLPRWTPKAKALMKKSPIDQALLDVLAVEPHPISGREVARLTRLGLDKVSRALERLAIEGKVIQSHNGASTAYSAPPSVARTGNG